jgi:3-oxoacyl-[acyl-carrier-protein] synthase II
MQPEENALIQGQGAAQADKAYELGARRAVVTGVGLVTPMADDVAKLSERVEAGEHGFTPVTRFDTSWCETSLACAYPAEADAGFQAASFRRKWMDRAAWYLLDALAKSLEQAGVDLKAYAPERIAVVLGTSHSGLVTTEELYTAALAGELEQQDPRRILAIPASHISAAVATAIGAKGVRRTVSSACASSTAAMGIAADLIRNNEADLVITGGTDTVSLAVMAGFNSLRALAPEGARPFSSTPGITLGEGAGVFVLERLDRAAARGAAVHAEILGYALSGDAHHATAPDDNGDGIRRVLQAALADAGVKSEEVQYISAHGTGTDANDVAESRAIAALFGTSVPLSTSKSTFGHTLGASGVIETALVLGMAERGKIPPTLRFETLRPGCEALDYVPNAAREAEVDTFVCNNYGFGGNNASVVFRRHPTGPAQGAARRTAKRRVVISGAGLLNSYDASGIAARAGLSRRPEPEAARFLVSDPRLPTHLKRQVGRASPMVKYAVSATGEALAAAALPEAMHAETGLIFSVVTGAQRSTEKFMESVFVHSPGLASAQYFPHTTNNAPAGQVSICYGLKGYSATLCGPAGALGYAISLVADSRQNRVVCAGADEHTELLERFYAHAGVVTPNPVRAFDGQTGVNFAEGACALLLEAAEAVRERGHRPLAEVRAFAEYQDGTHTGVSRSGAALQRAMVAALARAGLCPEDVDAVICHGAGPGYTARAESRAIEAVFGAQPPRLLGMANSGYGPAHTPIAMLASAATLVSTENLPAELGAARPRVVLCAGIDLTGVSFASVVAVEG